MHPNIRTESVNAEANENKGNVKRKKEESHLFVVNNSRCVFVREHSSLQAILWDQNLKCIFANKQNKRFLFCYDLILEKQL